MEKIDAVITIASINDSNRLTSNDTQALRLFNRLFHDSENKDPTHMAISEGMNITIKVRFMVITGMAQFLTDLLPINSMNC